MICCSNVFYYIHQNHFVYNSYIFCHIISCHIIKHIILHSQVDGNYAVGVTWDNTDGTVTIVAFDEEGTVIGHESISDVLPGEAVVVEEVSAGADDGTAMIGEDNVRVYDDVHTTAGMFSYFCIGILKRREGQLFF